MRTVKHSLTFAILTLALSACQVDSALYGPRPVSIGTVTKSVPGLEEVTYEPKVDILFVIDDSYSMLPHQEDLAENISLFVDELAKNAQLDFHIAVTTVFDKRSYDKQRSTPGYKVQPPAGELRPLKTVDSHGNFVEAADGPRYVHRGIPNFAQILKTSLVVGQYKIDEGGTEFEESFSPVFAAFSPQMMNSPANSGFYRQDAHLMIIFITDTDDQTEGGSAVELHSFLSKLKKDPAMISYHAVLAHIPIPGVDPAKFNYEQDTQNLPKNPVHSHREYINFAANHQDTCHSPYDPDLGEPYLYPTRISELLKLQTNSYTEESTRALSLCAKYGKDLGNIGLQLKKYLLKRVVKLDGTPEAGTMSITYGEPGSEIFQRQLVPQSNSNGTPYDQGWVYDNNTHILTIHEGIKIVPKPNGRFFVSYKPALHPNADAQPTSTPPAKQP